MNRITSFSVDHDRITPGLYISRIDGDVTTYDLRTRTPNAGDYMSNLTMHSVEHMAATFLRNSELSEQILYFGPMGCRTGFYLLVRETAPEEVLRVLKESLAGIVAYDGPMFGASQKECGNYREHDLEGAKREGAMMAEVMENVTVETLVYPE